MRALGLPDEAFEQRAPLKGQITKREVRAVALYSLGLRADSLVWDIGAGTGSISVEAGLIASQGRVYAIERDPDSLPLLEENIARWGGPNIQVVAGEAPQALAELPDPDSVFIGGSGGHLDLIIDEAAGRLQPGGRLVINLAVLERTQSAYHRLKALGLSAEMVMVHAARGKEMPGDTVRLESLNPVFVLTGKRKD
ncbi:MAG: precorrin-6Y C5,15-methyltransferase (decarboxylating) subunit CbiT [Chloroflexi bacterium]|nr:precorrin-6Y C5,15-methyltransferase (decarboxylating) subunit CbiT [Chloroflexota bacterium]